MNTSTPILIKFGVDLIVGSIIRKGGTPAAEATKAQEVIDVCAALGTINGGDVTNGITALEAAISTPSTDPATQMEIQLAIGFLATKASALEALNSGTLLGGLNAAIVSGVLAEATAVAQAYLPKPAK